MLLRELLSLLIIENVLRQRPHGFYGCGTMHGKHCTAQTAMVVYGCLYTGRCVDWTEMQSSRRVADRPAVQFGKTQRSSFMCIHVDDDDCEHVSAK